MTNDLAWPQSSGQQTTGVTLKDQQGVIHVLVITTIEKAELLLPVRGIVGGIDFEQDLPSFPDLFLADPYKPIEQSILQLNLIFDGNIFSDLQGPGLFLSTANNVVIANNQFINTNLSRLQNATVGTANLGGSVVVTQAHKVYIGRNPMQGVTTGPVSIDTRSTDGIRHLNSGHRP